MDLVICRVILVCLCSALQARNVQGTEPILASNDYSDNNGFAEIPPRFAIRMSRFNTAVDIRLKLLVIHNLPLLFDPISLMVINNYSRILQFRKYGSGLEKLLRQLISIIQVNVTLP